MNRNLKFRIVFVCSCSKEIMSNHYGYYNAKIGAEYVRDAIASEC